jgi:glyoxylase-like metal-dependent hydrolase (beta-lactamase superfamily II)
MKPNVLRARAFFSSAFLCLPLTLLCSCTHLGETTSREPASSQSPVQGLGLPKTAEVSLTSSGDGRIGTYTSSWKGFRTSSFWIEGPTGLILIDTQFLPTATEEMVDWAEKVTGKKAVLAIILHPNPDKFNGTATLQKRGVKVVTSDEVAKLIPAVHKLRTEWFYDRFKPDYPVETPQPSSFGSETKEISAGGVVVKAHVLGAGCSAAHVVVEFEKHVFVGDLVTQGFHSWLELGLVKPWLQRLDEIEKMKPEFVHVGRGISGDLDAVKHQRSYLQSVLRIVESYHPSKSHHLTETIAAAILKKVTALYPSYEYPTFVENGVEAVWSQLADDRQKK